MNQTQDPPTPPTPPPTSSVGSVIPLELSNKAALYAAYMPFLKNGGLFVRTDKIFNLGDEVFILLKLMDNVEKFNVAGKVVWISPKGAQEGLVAGIGIQFDAAVASVRQKIEDYLAGMLQSERRTDTM